jgi:hypothetical protein
MDNKQMEKALRIIGYSYHTNSKRKGPKAQCARWGLGEDDYPVEWSILEQRNDPTDNIEPKE